MKIPRNVLRFITSDPAIQGGRLIFLGTRIPVTTALECMEAGLSVEDILRAFPSLNRRAIRAAIQYARLRLQGEEFVPLDKAG